MHPNEAFEPFFTSAPRDGGDAARAVPAFRFDGWSHAPLELARPAAAERRGEAVPGAAPLLA